MEQNRAKSNNGFLVMRFAKGIASSGCVRVVSRDQKWRFVYFLFSFLKIETGDFGSEGCLRSNK